uniref:Cytochrome P450 n=1 Tax=Stomoxys calcitrans TaxID=35570 RepID=A0A1I8PBH4_STOCA
MWLELLLFAAAGAVLFYRWATKNNDFFKQRNVPYGKPAFLFGTVKEITLNKKSRFDAMIEFYNQHNGPIYGSFDHRDPLLVIRDPQLIKRILIKDFDHFVNRRGAFAEGSDNMFGNSLFLMEDDRWRDMRNTLSPAFTGSKMRQMFQLILQSIHEAMTYLKEYQMDEETSVEGFEMDVKDFTTRLTNDIIASTAFGLEVNSFRDKDNEFYKKAMYIMSFPPWIQIKLMFTMIFPTLSKYLNVNIFGKEYTDYFTNLVFDVMKYRQQHNIQRPDLIHLLMETRGMIASDNAKPHNREWSDLDLVAQCFAFFFAALETSSLVMSFAAHELMEYPQVQQKLWEEIHKTEDALEEGQLVTPEIIQKMSYLDMVLSEVLRKWPVNVFTDRKCTKDYVYQLPETGERIEIRQGDILRIIMSGLQRDPSYYENPDVFDPERFSEENKSKIDAGIYLPFGLGPRSCIGMRFALLEVKTFLYYLVRDYQLEASPKTTLPMEISTANLHFQPKGGFWLKFKPRN